MRKRANKMATARIIEGRVGKSEETGSHSRLSAHRPLAVFRRENAQSGKRPQRGEAAVFTGYFLGSKSIERSYKEGFGFYRNIRRSVVRVLISIYHHDNLTPHCLSSPRCT